MSYRLVIFDWDGTLLDSTGQIVTSMRYAAEQLQWRLPEPGEVRSIIGLGLPEAIRTLFPGADDEAVAALRAHYAHHFTDPVNDTSRFFPGAPELLAELHQGGFFLAVATGKARAGLQRVWQTHAVGHYFHASRCVDETHSKPHPAMVRELLAELSVDPGEALMIGDTSFDLDMARSAGVDAVGVRFGAHPPARLAASDPMTLIDELHELRPLLGLPRAEMETSL